MHRTFILGVDAAWTAHHLSGIALLDITTQPKPRIIRVVRSYLGSRKDSPKLQHQKSEI